MFPLVHVLAGYMIYVMINCVRWHTGLLGGGMLGARLGSGGGDCEFGRMIC
jgi:hypothetical protein